MLIEYRIRYEADGGVTVSQRIEPDYDDALVTAPAGPDETSTTVELGTVKRKPEDPGDNGGGPGGKTGVGGGPGGKTGVGGGPGATAPIVILGPIVIGGKPVRNIRPDAPRS